MVPLRQKEAAELMIAMNKYAVPYAGSLLAATPQSQLVDPGNLSNSDSKSSPAP